MAVQNRTIDEAALHAFLAQGVTELGATVNAALIVLGDRLGLYRALAQEGPLTSGELAARTDTAERYVREWLAAQAAGGYVRYDPASGRYSLTPEQELALADESSPAFLPGAFQLALGAVRDVEPVQEAFATGTGYGWGEHDHDVFEGCERFFRPSYRAHLVSEWIPALDGVERRLRAGARGADVGCGHGASTILMARAYPRSSFDGYDSHPASIEVARQRAEEAGVADRVRFWVAPAEELPARGVYDFVACFDALHDMGDPIGAAARVRAALARHGTWMVVEPFAGDAVEDNLTPVGRAYYAFSTLLCTPGALAQPGGLALGAQAGEGRLRDVLAAGGFTRVRRAAETPFNLVLEARA